jgi:serine/threonine protein kinase
MTEDVFRIVGTLVGGAYQVEKVVAEGGFGVVYRAHHGGFRAKVALKCLKIPSQLGPGDQQSFLEQFRAEAELLFRLSARIPSVVRPLHVDAFMTADGRFVPYMALEWLEGETLDGLIKERNRLNRSPFSIEELVRLLTPVAGALERAHDFSGPEGRVSIVHRDLKPENIFVAKVAGEQTVKILDFGIGKAKSVASQVAGRASQDAGTMTLFTPAYGAPEQWVPKRFGQTGPWTDVWGLALTMVEALAGRPVMGGDPSAMMGTALDPERRPTPRAEGVPVSDAVEAVFKRALAVDPRERHANAGAFWKDLSAALSARPAASVPGALAPLAKPSPSARKLSESRLLPSQGGPIASLLERAEETPVVRRLLPGGALVLLAVVVTLADRLYAVASGEVFAIGPLRASWFGALLLTAGIGLAAHELARRS